ncbi:AAA-like domain-containing protein, partial [Moorena sp. SIO4A5]|uniref:AAA-like domain-containing protein n=1 Tax=Moorena sp. SIO4A5 TaxID=2607838 RepID=UPI0013C57982
RLIKTLKFQQDDLLLDEDGTVLLSEDELLPPRHSFDSNWLNELEAPEGTVKLRSKLYLQRENEATWLDKVLGWGETIRVKGAHQMGKSSLLARMHQRAKQNSQAALYLDFQRLDQKCLSTLDSLLRYIAARMTKHWLTSRSPDSYWSSPLGSKDKLSDFVVEEVLEKFDLPILLIFDDVDRVFKYDYRDDFFSLIRAWHNERAIEEQWQKLNLVLAYSTEAFLFIQDLNQSPFNVGISIELGDLSRSKVEEMNRKHNSIARSGEIDSLINLLGGHPYLLRMAFYTMVTGSISVTEFCRVAGNDDGPFAEHLSRYLRQLEASPDLRHAMQDVLRKHQCQDNEIFYRLRKSGLILGHSPDAVQARCQLYAQYFKTRL